MKHYEFEMSLYLDGELPKENEMELFSHLTGCEECRKEFLKFHLVKEKTKNHFTKKLEVNELKKDNRSKIYKIGFYAVSTAAVLVFFLLSKEPETVYLSKTDVRVDTLIVPKEKVVMRYLKQKDKTYTKSIKSKGKIPISKEDVTYLISLSEMRTEKFSESDVL